MQDNKISKGNEDILKIFAELEEKAKSINPNLISDIKSFNDNHIALESYQNFINALNQSPILTTSNFVSQ